MIRFNSLETKMSIVVSLLVAVLMVASAFSVMAVIAGVLVSALIVCLSMRSLTAPLAIALKESEQERARSEAFIAAIGDFVTVIDTDFRILYQNPTAREIMGDRVEEHCFSAYHGRGAICDGCLVIAAFQDGEIHRGEKETILADGGRRQLEFTVSPVRDGSGKTVAAIELVRDITERKHAEWRLASQIAVSSILAESPTVGEAIPRVLEAICQAIGWAMGGVWWVDQRKDLLLLYDMWHKTDLDVAAFKEINLKITFAPGIGLPGRVWADGKAAWIPDILQDDNFPRRPFAEKSGLHGAFALPIILGGTIVGVMEFFNRDIRESDPGLLSAMVPLGIQLGQLIERKHAEQSLRESERRFRETLENIHLLAAELDPAGRILFCNDFLLKLTGWKREEILGLNWFELFIPPESDLGARFAEEIGNEVLPGHCEYEIVTRSGERHFISWNRTTLYDSDGVVSGIASIGEDVTEQKRAKSELIYFSTHDPLTGLYNRAFFEEELKRLERGRQFPVSIIMIDVDGLKGINDTLGHEAGDSLIRMAARVLLKAFRAEDVLARIGGDEFAVLLPETDVPDSEAAVARIRKCQKDANSESDVLNLSMSLGVATANIGAEIPYALKLSDELMYREKFARKKMLPADPPISSGCHVAGT